MKTSGNIIASAEEVQQGDPLGPLLFSLAIHPLLSSCKAEFRVGYLDDLSLAGEISQVATEVDILQEEALKLGLSLNVSKCELISTLPLTFVPPALAGFCRVVAEDSVMLGAPLGPGLARDTVWESHSANLNRAEGRLSNLCAHDALALLKNSLSLPKLLFHLRCTFSGDHPSLPLLDNKLRDMLRQILNVDLSDDQWEQASLPVKRLRDKESLSGRLFCLFGFGDWGIYPSVLYPSPSI